MRRVLVTGFDAFGGLAENVSECVVKRLAAAPPEDCVFTAVILKTAFDTAASDIARLIRDGTPDIVLCCGLAQNASALRLERVARNRDDARGADNAGEQRACRPVVTDGPESYAATLPYAAIAAGLEHARIGFEFSDDAGGFVCNHIFYRACHVIAERAMPSLCGFIHLPPESVLPLQQMEAALRLSIAAALRTVHH